ncbi:MAG: hypothetical protein A3B68_08010 [Candidatus Melainabacteria bacterium RIFCSPHIGHO2_02_FULL_34_12]|nr:MAG: hypothetical protein A3B68_08010 [Candidatus Melainabacteria bacterium RIFCSPHIGHO2_02_FULL_34_12]
MPPKVESNNDVIVVRGGSTKRADVPTGIGYAERKSDDSNSKNTSDSYVSPFKEIKTARETIKDKEQLINFLENFKHLGTRKEVEKMVNDYFKEHEKQSKQLSELVTTGFDRSSTDEDVKKFFENCILTERETSSIINRGTISRETGELFTGKSIGLHIAALNPLGLMLGGPIVTTIHDVPRGWNIFTSTLSEGWGWLTE